jgi:hypothetical protein
MNRSVSQSVRRKIDDTRKMKNEAQKETIKMMMTAGFGLAANK